MRWVANLDPWLATCVFSPLVIAYWRGTWQLLDLYILPQDPCLNCFTSLALGIGIIIVLTLSQQHFNEAFNRHQSNLFIYVIITRLHTLLLGFAGVNHWRGIWFLMQCQFGIEWWSASGAVLVGTSILGFFRTLRSTLAPPFMITMDNDNDYFLISTRYRTKPRCSNWTFVLDVHFSVMVLGSSVVVVWWGVWTLLDIFIFTNSVLSSTIFSIVAGVIVAAVLFFLQPIIVQNSRHLSFGWRILLDDFFVFTATVGAINLWRGLWSLQDIFVFPDDPVLSNTASHFVGIFLLLLFQNSNSILVKGVPSDNDFTDRYFNIEYCSKLEQIIYVHPFKDETIKRRKDKKPLKNSFTQDSFSSKRKFQLSETRDLMDPLWIPRGPIMENGKFPCVVIDRITVV